MGVKFEAYCPIWYEKAVFDTVEEAGEWSERHIKGHRDYYLSTRWIMPTAKIIVAKATDKIDEEVLRASETYAAGGEEKTKVTITAEGAVTITQDGDGDAAVTMRIYVDGALAQSETADKACIYTAGFTSSLEIRSFADGVTAYCSHMHVSGWRFV